MSQRRIYRLIMFINDNLARLEIKRSIIEPNESSKESNTHLYAIDQFTAKFETKKDLMDYISKISNLTIDSCYVVISSTYGGKEFFQDPIFGDNSLIKMKHANYVDLDSEDELYIQTLDKFIDVYISNPKVREFLEFKMPSYPSYLDSKTRDLFKIYINHPSEGNLMELKDSLVHYKKFRSLAYGLKQYIRKSSGLEMYSEVKSYGDALFNKRADYKQPICNIDGEQLSLEAVNRVEDIFDYYKGQGVNIPRTKENEKRLIKEFKDNKY